MDAAAVADEAKERRRENGARRMQDMGVYQDGEGEDEDEEMEISYMVGWCDIADAGRAKGRRGHQRDPTVRTSVHRACLVLGGAVGGGCVT